ncbi:MAG: hypothetical protein ABI758_01015 [Candidatus Woesebacteria bacterium]
MIDSQEHSYTQFAFPFADNVTTSKRQTAVQISTSGYEVWQDFYNNDIRWDELFEKLLASLSPMYVGIIGHTYLQFSSMFMQIAKLHSEDVYMRPEHYSLYMDKTLGPVFQLLFSSIDVTGELFEKRSAFDLAWALTAGWRSQHNFYDRVPKLSQMTLSEHILYEPNYREDRWFDSESELGVSPKLEQLHENTEFVFERDVSFGGKIDFVSEVPMNAYLWTEYGQLMSWIRPDRVSVDKETGIITVQNIKFTKPKNRSDLEAIDWIQITLEALAGRKIAQKAKLLGNRRKTQFSKPLFAEYRVEDLELYLPKIKVEYVYPNTADGNSFLHCDFTPTSTELAAVAYSLGYIARDLNTESKRNSFYKYSQIRKKRIEGITPKTMIVPTLPVQPIIRQFLSTL